MSLIQYLTQIRLGPGELAALKEETERLSIRRPLLVTDAGVQHAGLAGRALAALGADGQVPVYDRTPPNPNEAAVREATSLYAAEGCDGIMALGGGSVIDLAKGVALAATHPGPLVRYAAIEGGVGRITGAVAPVIAIPTTAGTGSEVGRAAILILEDGRKLGLISPHMIPKAAICDPDLTLGLPPGLTAATGMDAIAHCIETFLAPAFNPPADGIALDGLRRAWRAIEHAVADGTDRGARLDMMAASTEGALAFQKGLGAVHSLSHAIGAFDPRLHHGTLNAILLPAIIRFNAEAESVRAEDKIGRLAQAMDLPPGTEVADAVFALVGRLGLPRRLSELGLPREAFGQIVAGALADHSHRTNPRTPDAEQYRTLLDASF